MSNPSRKKATDEDDEVEQLLRAAQDDMLLKLSLNSHLAHSSAIESDLDRRFQALKNPAPHLPADTSKIADSSAKKVSTIEKINKIGSGGGALTDDDLFARFAALKTSFPSSSKGKDRHSHNGESFSINQDQKLSEGSGIDDDEVEKMIKWAIDAARFDPSPTSDDDVSDTEDDESDDHDDDDNDEGKNVKKGKRK